MLIVKTIIKDSSIHGLGLFADEDIRKDQIIFIMDNLYVKSFPAEEVEALPEGKIKEFLDTFTWKSENCYYLSLDNDRFTNHSKDPNTYMKGIMVLAKVDIKTGEEITSNYEDFDEKPLKF